MLLTISSMSALFALQAKITRELQASSLSYRLALERAAAESSLTGRRAEGYLEIAGISPGEVKYVILIKKDGKIDVKGSGVLSGDDRGALLPLGLTEGSERVIIVLRSGVPIDVSTIGEEAPEGASAVAPSLFTLLLSKGLNSSELYKLLEEHAEFSDPVTVSAPLPIALTVKAENTSYIIELTPRDCPPGQVRVLYWGARSDYLINVTLGGTVLMQDRGSLQFTYTGSGTRSAHKAFPKAEGYTSLANVAGPLTLALSAEAYLELMASAPTPVDYCSNAFYYSQPTVGFNVRLNISVNLTHGATGISLVPGPPSLWAKRPSYYQEKTTLQGYHAAVDGIYVYLRSNALLVVSSSLYGTSQGGGEVSIYYPSLRLSYVEMT